ncbi:MAG: TIGR03862 family flavoprotein [Betaproteobacteria bacterium]
MKHLKVSAAVIGGGPAGLMAAEALCSEGIDVDLYDAMPSLGRKFLMAGKGGMNITHSEDEESFLSRYGRHSEALRRALTAFSPAAIRDWMRTLGIESFIGSSGRVFPTGMKAAPLLRAWLRRLRDSGACLHVRHRWLGWDTNGALVFATPTGETTIHHDAVILALGGGSWSKLGSDGAWVPLLRERGVEVAPLKPANCGFDIGWSDHFRDRYAGHPLKAITARFEGDGGRPIERRGEIMITATGIEGGLVYALSAALRDRIEIAESARLELDLLPDRSAAFVAAEIARPRGSRSLASHLQSRLGLKGVKTGLLREILTPDEMHDPIQLARTIKALPLHLIGPRPLDEAISSAGGVCFDALDENFMLRALPGVFCAGEMLDWEAPTGGYLLSGCLATGRVAGHGAVAWLNRRR